MIRNPGIDATAKEALYELVFLFKKLENKLVRSETIRDVS